MHRCRPHNGGNVTRRQIECNAHQDINYHLGTFCFNFQAHSLLALVSNTCSTCNLSLPHAHTYTQLINNSRGGWLARGAEVSAFALVALGPALAPTLSLITGLASF